MASFLAIISSYLGVRLLYYRFQQFIPSLSVVIFKFSVIILQFTVILVACFGCLGLVFVVLALFFYRLWKVWHRLCILSVVFVCFNVVFGNSDIVYVRDCLILRRFPINFEHLIIDIGRYGIVFRFYAGTHGQ